VVLKTGEINGIYYIGLQGGDLMKVEHLLEKLSSETKYKNQGLLNLNPTNIPNNERVIKWF